MITLYPGDRAEQHQSDRQTYVLADADAAIATTARRCLPKGDGAELTMTVATTGLGLEITVSGGIAGARYEVLNGGRRYFVQTTLKTPSTTPRVKVSERVESVAVPSNVNGVITDKTVTRKVVEVSQPTFAKGMTGDMVRGTIVVVRVGGLHEVVTPESA